MQTPPDDFRALSARLGNDPLQVQGPGGNTSIKYGNTMWIKASGTELAEANTTNIFVAVDRAAAMAEAHGAGDGTCKATVLDPENTLRPSIETTFHAALDWPVVAHTHSVATLVHAISPEGRKVAAEKLADLPAVFAAYAKPGLPLTGEILARVAAQTRVVVLQNHGLICTGTNVAEASDMIALVEERLAMPVVRDIAAPEGREMVGFERVAQSWMAFDPQVTKLVLAGSYYPDHVVFLGPALPTSEHDGKPPALLMPGEGVYLRDGATASQRAMVTCLADCFARLPADWSVEAIGTEAEAELLNWDAEKYRQALAAKA